MTCYIYHVYNNNNQRRPLPSRYFDGNAPEEDNYYRIWRRLEQLPAGYMNRGIVRTVKRKTGRQMFGLIPFVGAVRNA